MLKVMFQAWLVKIANTQASSAPSTRPGNKFMKKTTVKVRKPRIGTDCRISSRGISTISARRPLAARGRRMTGKNMRENEEGDQHHLGAPALGGKGGVDEGENDRANDGQQHPHGRSQRIERQVGRIERHWSNVEGGQGRPGLAATVDDEHHGADDKNQRNDIPDVGPQRLPQYGWANILKRHESRLVQNSPCSRPEKIETGPRSAL